MTNSPLKEQQSISFGRLLYESLPEIWTFQLLAAIVLAFPVMILTKLIYRVAESGGVTLTSANLRQFLLSWRAPALLLLGIILVLCYIVIEIAAQIYMNEDILRGGHTRIWSEIRKGLLALRRFLNPSGILVLLYIFIAVPLCGIGFSISLTETFYIPNFIMEVIQSTPLYALLYGLVILMLIWVGYRFVFTVHGVLLDGKTPIEASRLSARLIQKNRRIFLIGMLKLLSVLLLIQIAAGLLFRFLPGLWLERQGLQLPQNHYIDIIQLLSSTPSETDFAVLSYRILCSLLVLLGAYLNSIVSLLSAAYLMLRLTRYYLAFTQGENGTWPARPKKSRYYWKALLMIGMSVFVLIVSIGAGLFYNQLIEKQEKVHLIAHRAGGSMAAENSLEGLRLAIEHGCYGSEIDVQRSKDGHYIINHDKTFQRMTGIDKAAQDLSLEEIRRLRIHDNSGAEHSVATLEEMLEVIRGKEKLFIELKGDSADKQMVDDVVRIVSQANCVEDCALISLDYELIDYAETRYPEFETGTLFFIGLGDVSKLNCDLLIMEEESATDARLQQVQAAGKQSIVWTVNTEAGLKRFLDSEVNAIITDEVPNAKLVQEALNKRTDLQVLQDKLSDLWH